MCTVVQLFTRRETDTIITTIAQNTNKNPQTKTENTA